MLIYVYLGYMVNSFYLQEKLKIAATSEVK